VRNTATLLHGSGFVAVFLTGVVIGNSSIPHRNATVGFAEAGAAVSQIGLFVLLGVLASPSRLPEEIWPALVIGGILTFLARPIATVVSAVPFGVRDWQSLTFMSWAGLRGAVPIAAATIPISEGVPFSEKIFDIVFVLVVVYTVVQAPPLPWLARRLGLGKQGTPRDVAVESAPLEDMRADLLQFTIPESSLMHGVYVDELLLPSDAHVSLVVREGRAQVPERYMRLMRGDQVLVVTTRAVRDITEKRLQAVSDHGRLAQWRNPVPGEDDDE
jgi:cell volume regulation protein A